MVEDIKVVIGANYGDEGKGRMTALFAKNAPKYQTLVIRSNGGAQAGHTVSTGENGKRIVFGHFGSGTAIGCPTYLSKNFIVNPMFFKKEWERLKLAGYNPKVYVHEDCIVTTPYDIFVNQAWEASLGKERYGSCGAGIYETVLRNNTKNFKTTVSDMANKDANYKGLIAKDFISLVGKIEKDYFKIRLFSALQSDEVPVPYDEIMQNSFKYPFLVDCLFFLRHVTIITKQNEKKFLNEFKTLVFEGAQGLLLDQRREIYGERVTPSYTGLKNPFEIIYSNGLENVPIEVCYCSRWYMTRHGAGKLANEKRCREISAKIEDKTNVPNAFQGNLRFGILDIDSLILRATTDFKEFSCGLDNMKLSFSFICLDQMGKEKNPFIVDCDKKMGSSKDFIQTVTEKIITINKIYKLYLGWGEDFSLTASKTFVNGGVAK